MSEITLATLERLCDGDCIQCETEAECGELFCFACRADVDRRRQRHRRELGYALDALTVPCGACGGVAELQEGDGGSLVYACGCGWGAKR